MPLFFGLTILYRLTAAFGLLSFLVNFWKINLNEFGAAAVSGFRERVDAAVTAARPFIEEVGEILAVDIKIHSDWLMLSLISSYPFAMFSVLMFGYVVYMLRVHRKLFVLELLYAIAAIYGVMYLFFKSISVSPFWFPAVPEVIILILVGFCYAGFAAISANAFYWPTDEQHPYLQFGRFDKRRYTLLITKTRGLNIAGVTLQALFTIGWLIVFAMPNL